MHASALRLVRRGLATAAAHPPHAGPSSSHVTAATSAIPLSNVEAQWATLSPAEQTAVHQQLEELQRKDWKTLSLSEKKAGASICPYLISSPPSLVGGRRGRGRQSVELVVHASCTVQPTMLRLARMDLVRRSTHLAQSSRSSLASPSSLAPPVCFMLASALWVCWVHQSLMIPCSRQLFPFFSFQKKNCTAPPPPKSISKEWEEATNERARELKINPITGS